MSEEYYYIPINHMNNTLILGIFDTTSQAINASVNFLQKRDNFNEIFNKMEKEFNTKFDKPFNLKELKQIIFCGSIFYGESDADEEIYEELCDFATDDLVSITIHAIKYNTENANIIDMICSYTNWVNINGRNQLELLLDYKFGNSDAFEVDLDALAKEFPL